MSIFLELMGTSIFDFEIGDVIFLLISNSSFDFSIDSKTLILARLKSKI
jgi:hypothetical protein